MSRYQALVETYQNGEETPEEAVELARLVEEEPGRAGVLYDALMLEANLFEIYGGIARVQDAPPVRRIRISPRIVATWAFAVFLLVGLAVLLFLGTPSPASAPEPAPAVPSPPAPPEPEFQEDHDSKRGEIEREYRKGLREVERKRLEGKAAEAAKKQQEIEREREKQLRDLERRKVDR